MSNKDTALYVGLWEKLHNDKFNSVEFHRVKIDEVGYNDAESMEKRIQFYWIEFKLYQKKFERINTFYKVKKK